MIERICKSLDMLDGAFAFLILIEDRLYVARDKYGLRPLSIGILPNGAYVFASETCALDIVGANFVRDVEPGEIVRVKDGKLKAMTYTKDPVVDKICAMEKEKIIERKRICFYFNYYDNSGFGNNRLR